MYSYNEYTPLAGGYPGAYPMKQGGGNKILLVILILAVCGGAFYLFGTDSGSSLVGGSSESGTGSNSNYHAGAGGGVTYSTRTEALSRAAKNVGTAINSMKDGYKITNPGFVAHAYGWAGLMSSTDATAVKTLLNYTYACSKDSLKAGDLLIDETNNFVVMFSSFTTNAKDNYNLYYASPGDKVVVSKTFDYPFPINPTTGAPWRDVQPRCIKSTYVTGTDAPPSVAPNTGGGSSNDNNNDNNNNNGGNTSGYSCSSLGSKSVGHWSCQPDDRDCFNYVAKNCYTDSDWKSFSTKLEKNFSLGEFVLNKTSRLPSKDSVIPSPTYSPRSDIVTIPYNEVRGNLLAIAHQAQLVRDAWSAKYGGGLKITSGFRPYTYTAQATFSRHKYGDAIDCKPTSGSLSTFQSWVDARWNGGLGYGAHKGFVHLDLRGEAPGFCGASGSCKTGTRWDY